MLKSQLKSYQKSDDKIISTKTGYCVYNPLLLKKRITEYKSENLHRDEHKKNRATKERIRRLIKSGEEKIKKQVSDSDIDMTKDKKLLKLLEFRKPESPFFLKSDIPTGFAKFLREKDILQKKFSLKSRTSWGPISKYEILKEIVAPFAFEIRDKKVLEWFLAKKLARNDSGNYIIRDMFLRKKVDVVKMVVRILLDENYEPSDFRTKESRQNLPDTTSEYQNIYQAVNRAYIALKKDFHFMKKIRKKLDLKETISKK